MNFIVGLIIFIMASIPQYGWSTPQPELSPIEIAQNELVQGHKLIKANKIKEGIRVLRRAYRAYPSPEILVFLGKIYDRFPQGCPRALATWRQLVDTCHEICPFRQESLARLKNAELECQGSLTIKSNPTKAEVFIEDQLKGVTPLTLQISEARSFKIVALKNGYELIKHQVKLGRKWGQQEVTIQLKAQLKNRGSISPIYRSQKYPKTLAVTQNKTQTTQMTQRAHREQSSRDTSDSNKSATYKAQPISSPFGINEDPFLRRKHPAKITHGQIATSGDRSMISALRCEYRTRFKKYINLDRCDGAHLSMLDRFYVAVKLQKEAYVYVIMSNDQGQWSLIFPEPLENNLLRANQLIELPHKEWVVLDGVENTTDIISILASPKPIPILDGQRSHSKSTQVPHSLMRYFIPMSDIYQGEISSAKTMNRKTHHAAQSPLVLHISYRIHR
jgi:hypothetical protein